MISRDADLSLLEDNRTQFQTLPLFSAPTERKMSLKKDVPNMHGEKG